MKFAIGGKDGRLHHVDASRPRTFSSTRTNSVPSENRTARLAPTSIPNSRQIAAVSRGLPLPAKISGSSSSAMVPAREDAGAEDAHGCHRCLADGRPFRQSAGRGYRPPMNRRHRDDHLRRWSFRRRPCSAAPVFGNVLPERVEPALAHRAIEGAEAEPRVEGFEACIA